MQIYFLICFLMKYRDFSVKKTVKISENTILIFNVCKKRAFFYKLSAKSLAQKV